MSDALVQVTVSESVATLRLAKPPVNAIDIELIEEVGDRLIDLKTSHGVQALVITGSGRSFSAGLDLKVVPTYDPGQQRRMIESVNRSIAELYSLPMPTVAAVNGHAIAGGLVLALACDYRIGALGDFSFGLTETRAGIPFPAAPMAIVNAELTSAVARRLTLVARNSGPREALAEGILDEVCEPDQLPERAAAFAAELATAGASTYARVKAQLRAATIELLEDIVENANDPLLDTWISEDAKTSAASLLESTHED